MLLGRPSLISQGRPPVFERFITQGQWDAAVARFRSIESDAECLACGIEWGTCLCFGLFCVFCCHGCIKDQMMRQELEKYCRDLNQSYFGGNTIFFVGQDCSVTAADDRLATIPTPGLQPFYTAPAGQPVYVTTAQPMYVPQSPPMVSAAIVQPYPVNNTAQFAIDQYMIPGGTVAVTAPNGMLVNITIPKDATPGCVLTYVY